MCGYSVGKGNIKNNFKPAFVDKTGQIELSYLISERVRLSAFDGYITNFNLSVTPFIGKYKWSTNYDYSKHLWH